MFRHLCFAGTLGFMLAFLMAPASGFEFSWGYICSAFGPYPAHAALRIEAPTPTARCGALPSGFTDLPSVGGYGDTHVNLSIGYDPDTNRLCYVNTSLPTAPVIRVGVGHTLSITIANTLHDTGVPATANCAINNFGSEGVCVPLPQYVEQPGPDGPYYPIMANEAHEADGTSNLHVHGLLVSPTACSDETLKSTIYPANWGAGLAPLQPCQPAADTLTYTYQIPADHPDGLYWYHTHRHGEAEQATQMGLVGAIVVQDAGDVWRNSIGVTDQVLVVDDTPITACQDGVACDLARRQSLAVKASARQAARRQNEATSVEAVAASSGPKLDPRIDQIDQAGECSQGATGSSGGIELWTLTLNGAAVPENFDGTFPPDNELLSKTMRPNQRQIFRLVNASADSFLAPQLVMVQHGVTTYPHLEIFARDGVGIADAIGNRHFDFLDNRSGQLIVPPAGRLEFVVHAPPAGATLYLQSAQVNPGCGGNAYPARRLLRITSAGTPVAAGIRGDYDLFEHTPSLKPFFATLGTTASVHRTFVFSEYGRDFTYRKTRWLSGPPTVAAFNPNDTDFFLTEVAADDGSVNPKVTTVQPFVMTSLAPQVVVHLHGRPSVTEEWLIENSTLEIHAFHIHQVHFRDITTSPTDLNLQPVLDTITVPAAPLIGDVATGRPGAPGWVKLRLTFTTADIGEFMYHCHILEHEDNGMMGKIQVVAD